MEREAGGLELPDSIVVEAGQRRNQKIFLSQYGCCQSAAPALHYRSCYGPAYDGHDANSTNNAIALYPIQERRVRGRCLRATKVNGAHRMMFDRLCRTERSADRRRDVGTQRPGADSSTAL